MHRKHIKKRSENLTQTLRNSNHQNHKNHWKTQGKSIKIKELQVRILLRKLKTYIRFSIIVCIIFSSFSGRNFNMFSMIFGIKKQWKIAMFLDIVFFIDLDPFCTHFELILAPSWEPWAPLFSRKGLRHSPAGPHRSSHLLLRLLCCCGGVLLRSSHRFRHPPSAPRPPKWAQRLPKSIQKGT